MEMRLVWDITTSLSSTYWVISIRTILSQSVPIVNIIDHVGEILSISTQSNIYVPSTLLKLSH